ncbi:MAG TPA: hypothetical protein VEJ84_05795 [Acidimicrobiales bacterium]|nr:hypothetical protein [Acidimicrobiales bacterium]
MSTSEPQPTATAATWHLIEQYAEPVGVTANEVFGRSRYRQVVAVRHMVWRHMHKHWHWSAYAIAAVWGVEGSTVQAALRKEQP